MSSSGARVGPDCLPAGRPASLVRRRGPLSYSVAQPAAAGALVRTPWFAEARCARIRVPVERHVVELRETITRHRSCLRQKQTQTTGARQPAETARGVRQATQPKDRDDGQYDVTS